MPRYIADTVYIYASELQLIARYVDESPNKETGGDLFGNWTHQGCPLAQVAIGPGPEYRSDRFHFFQDGEYLREQGDILATKHALHHIGQWHSHHKLGLETPSPHDDETIFNAIEKYGLNEFLLIIATLQKEVCLRAFLYSSNKKRYGLKWHVLESNNPFIDRKELRDEKQPVCLDVEIKRASVERALSREDIWLNTEVGRDWLKSVDESLKEQCKNVNLYQDSYNQIVVACERDYQLFEYVIPEDYPEHPAYWRDLQAEKYFKIPQHG